MPASTMPAGSPTSRSRSRSRATPSRSMSRGGPTSRRCPGSRRSGCSRRSPVGSRWCRRRGTTARGCSRPARTTWWPTARPRCAGCSARCSTTARSPPSWPATAATPSSPATPARIASTSCSPSSASSGCPPIGQPGRTPRGSPPPHHRDPRRPRTPGPDVPTGMTIAFFGSSLVSAYWNGAATYYRGILCALADRGHRVTFYEPDAFERQQHRDLADPPWATVCVYPATTDAVAAMIERSRGADLVVKASGVGVHDELLERLVPELAGPRTLVAFWDVDAPATLDRLERDPGDPFRALIPRYDVV